MQFLIVDTNIHMTNANVYRYVPLNDIAGLCARNDAVAEVFFSRWI